MKKFLIILLSLTILFSLVSPVQAHFLAIDGSIGAVLHVDPNDQPIANSQASFFFEFKDKQNKFDPAKCECTFEIDENGKNLYSQPLFQNNINPSLTNASVTYIFSHKDVYQVKVVGKPTTPNAFQPFTLSWDFRVDQDANGQTSAGQSTRQKLNLIYLMYFAIIGIAIVGFLNYFLNNKRKKKIQKQPDKTSSGKKGGEEKDDKKDSNHIF